MSSYYTAVLFVLKVGGGGIESDWEGGEELLCGGVATPVKIIEKNDRSNAALGVRTLQNRSNGLKDVLIPRRWNGCLNVVLGT